MKKQLLGLLCIILFCSHDMFLKMDSYFINPNEEAIINLYNGTFEKSENIIDRERMLDASIVGLDNRKQIGDDQWTEKDSTTVLKFKSDKSGTYVAGVSTKARNIKMEADALNTYLEQEGVKGMLKQRKDNNTLDQDAVEKYSKHVKAIFQVGDERSDDWQTELGYPIEFIPLSNPYNLTTGDEIQVKLLHYGKPLANQRVYADFKPSKTSHTHDGDKNTHEHDSKPHLHPQAIEDDKHVHEHKSVEHEHQNAQNNSETHSHSHKDSNKTPGHSHDAEKHTKKHSHDKTSKSHSHENADEDHKHSPKSAQHSHDDGNMHSHDKDETGIENHTHTTGQELITNDKGVVSINLTDDGIWYLRTIHLVNSDEEGLTHESNWATLTFEVAHSHDNTDHIHEHDDGFPTYIFWLISIAVLAGLFFWFNRNRKKQL